VTPPFRLSCRRAGADVVVVAMAGELDYATEPRARAYLVECTATHPRHLVLDMSEVTFLPSQGLHLLMAAHLNEDRIRGALHLVGVTGNRPVEHVLGLVGMAAVLDIHPDLPALLGELTPS
jgi:anti-sigma B factor antagonist